MERLISKDGKTRVTAKLYAQPDRAILHVERRGDRGWMHVADCVTPEEVGKHVDLSTLQKVRLMAKKGEKRPHIVRFHWVGTTIRGTETFTSRERAYDFVRQLEETADRRDFTLEWEYTLRG